MVMSGGWQTVTVKNGADPVAHLKQKPLKKHMLYEPSFRSRIYVGKRCRSHGVSPVILLLKSQQG